MGREAWEEEGWGERERESEGKGGEKREVRLNNSSFAKQHSRSSHSTVN